MRGRTESPPPKPTISPAAPQRCVDQGRITVIAGCMFSGKTTELLQRLETYGAQTTVAIKHSADTRYRADAIVSHDGQSTPACCASVADEILVLAGSGPVVVAIDEGHFFGEDIVDVVEVLSLGGMDVLVALLDRDSWGRSFEIIEQLDLLAHESIRRTCVCARCGDSASRTQRLTPFEGDQLVGGPERYEPRCVSCWRPPPETVETQMMAC